jgi:hypothetical protein
VTDEERRRIAEEVHREADLENRVKNLETKIAEMQAGLVWGIRAIWGGVIYLGTQLWDFIASGGTLGR